MAAGSCNTVGIRCSVFIATSLDGFIARKDGSLDWLPGSDGAASEEDYGDREFYDSIDVLIIGRRTYELAKTFSEWPYSGKRAVVLSSRYPETPTPLADNVEGVSSSPEDVTRRLASAGFRHAYVDGGTTIRGFLRGGLIGELTITRVPVLLGEGIPLFGQSRGDIRMELLGARSFADGLVQSRYRVVGFAGE